MENKQELLSKQMTQSIQNTQAADMSLRPLRGTPTAAPLSTLTQAQWASQQQATQSQTQ